MSPSPTLYKKYHFVIQRKLDSNSILILKLILSKKSFPQQQAKKIVNIDKLKKPPTRRFYIDNMPAIDADLLFSSDKRRDIPRFAHDFYNLRSKSAAAFLFLFFFLLCGRLFKLLVSCLRSIYRAISRVFNNLVRDRHGATGKNILCGYRVHSSSKTGSDDGNLYLSFL